MKKNVWILNHYAGNTYFDQGGRHYNFAKYLKQAGYEPVVFCANSKHGAAECFFETDALWTEHTAQEIQTPFVYVKTRTYANNGKQRVLNMVDFYRNVKKTAKEYAAQHGKPDVIYASSVHPLTLVAGIQLAKKFGVKCICEVRDLWPESIVEYSSRLTKDNPLIKLLYAGEHWIYKKADALIFTFEGGYRYIEEKNWEKDVPKEKVHYINNGVDLEQFDHNKERWQIPDEDLENPDIFKVVYTGSIRRVNNLGMLLDAAKQVEDPRIKFLLWGAGDEVETLRRRVEEEHIQNVVFKGRVDKKCVPYIVSRADINFFHGDDIPLFRFGISPNKLFEYFASGRPVLMDGPASYNPVERFSCGFLGVGTGQLLENLKKAADLPAEAYEALCSQSRKAAEEYDFRNLTKKLIAIIER